MDVKRRDLFVVAGGALAASAGLRANVKEDSRHPTQGTASRVGSAGSASGNRGFNTSYAGQHLDRIAFPLGGMGAGMICLEGSGALTKFSLRHGPDLASEAPVFAALSVKGANFARVLEGPIPSHKRFPVFTQKSRAQMQGWWGLPRFREAAFQARFPFAEIRLADDDSPVDVAITGWSPFEPGQEDDASLPVAGLEYSFTNRTDTSVEAVFSFNAGNFLAGSDEGHIRRLEGGFILHGVTKDRPWTVGSFAVSTDDPAVKLNHAWFLGRHQRHIVWKDIADAACYDRPPIDKKSLEAPGGATLFVPFTLARGETKTIRIRVGWHVPYSNLRLAGGGSPDMVWQRQHETLQPTNGEDCYRPWYAGRYADVEQVMADWHKRYHALRLASERFSRTLFSSTLPPEVIEAVASNLSILKSPTLLRQIDGRLWGWEGSGDDVGLWEGSCTHVWNYAQAIPHLFPRLERGLRETEFGPCQNEEGHQAFRAALPIRPAPHDFIAAADGQLGGVMKVYRDWRISGDTDWLRTLWPKVRASLDYCIRTWDPSRRGWIEEPHHNTYDGEFWGPDGMCTSVYLGAMKAATLIGAALSEDTGSYANLLKLGTGRMESELFNGEYFYQKIMLTGLRARYPDDFGKNGFEAVLEPEELAIAVREGPANQYGSGCLSDGVIGAWMAWASGMEAPLSSHKIGSHLDAVHQYNFKTDLTKYADPTFAAARATYALGDEAGLLLCTWPKGDKLSLPFRYDAEVWTGIEYQVASHLIALDRIDEGLDIVRACRKRHDGSIRNPFSEVEAGHFYARAMSSYALLQALGGARYDAVEKILHLHPRVKGDFRSFLSTATGYGIIGVRNGQPFVDIASGTIAYKKIDYRAA